MRLFINEELAQVDGVNVDFQAIAFDGCHKIYLCETEKDIEDAKGLSYELHEPLALPAIWDMSCPLKFISTWSLETVVPQCYEEELGKPLTLQVRE